MTKKQGSTDRGSAGTRTSAQETLSTIRQREMAKRPTRAGGSEVPASSIGYYVERIASLAAMRAPTHGALREEEVMTSLRNIENERGTLDFVRQCSTGKVHVIVQRGPWWDPNPEYGDRWSRAVGRRDRAVGQPMTAGELLALAPRITMCGQVINTAYGIGNAILDCFADADLCGRCHRALGDQADRAFEHRQPGDPVEHDEQTSPRGRHDRRNRGTCSRSEAPDRARREAWPGDTGVGAAGG